MDFCNYMWPQLHCCNATRNFIVHSFDNRVRVKDASDSRAVRFVAKSHAYAEISSETVSDNNEERQEQVICGMGT